MPGQHLAQRNRVGVGVEPGHQGRTELGHRDLADQRVARPQGALPVEWTIFVSPVPELAEPSDPGPAAGSDDPDNLGSPDDVERE